MRRAYGRDARPRRRRYWRRTPARACRTSTARFCVSLSSRLEFLDRTPFVPQPGFEARRQPPVHDALHQAVLFAHFGQIRIVRVRREIVLDALQSRPGLLLLGRAQGRDVVGFLDFVDARFEIHALLRQAVEIGRRHDGIGLRHALRYRPPGGYPACHRRLRYVLAPGVQIAAHEIELAVILQAFLKFIARQQRVQVARFGSIGHGGQLPIPGQRVLLVVIQADGRAACPLRICSIESSITFFSASKDSIAEL